MPPAIVDTRWVYARVLDVYAPIAIGVFILFTLAIVMATLLYRRNDRPSRRHEANLLEGGYAFLLTLVAVFLLYVTLNAERTDGPVTAPTLAANHERPALTIDVVGARWVWTFIYLGHGITHRSGAIADQPLVVPVNEAVRFRITTADVIHSFWIPEVDFKHDAIPGSVQTVTLDFPQLGSFWGSCAEYCGLLHSYMVFRVDAISQPRFQAWLRAGGRTRA